LAAIFDMDGLLLDTEPLWGESMLEVANKHEVNIRSDFFKYTTGLRINEVTAFWQYKFGWKSAISSDVMANEIVENIIERSILKGRVMPGVINLLEDLKSNHVPLGVATSSPSVMMHTLLEHFNLKSYFNALVSAEYVGYGKPHPAVYMKCADDLGEESFKCVAFEDSINGMVAAKAARMQVVVVPDEYNFNKSSFGLADLKIKSLKYFSFKDYIKMM